MLKSRYFPLLAVLSFSTMVAYGPAFADVSFDEKKNRIEYLEELAEAAPAMNIDAFRRELQYEKQNLPLEKRAEKEANNLSQQIQRQVFLSYEAALAKKSSSEAYEEVKRAIDKDLALISPELQDELRELSYTALENAQKGITNTVVDLSAVESVMLKDVMYRSAFLNEEAEDLPMYSMAIETYDPEAPSVNKNKDAERKSYSKKSEILQSLVSDRESARWVSTSNQTIKSDVITKAETSIKMQLKVQFLGVDVEAGPVIAFSREFDTSVTINAEGLNPIILPDGNFDYMKRDQFGRVSTSGGKQQKRFVNFTCNADLKFESEYVGGGGFSVVGVGGGVAVGKKYSNTMSLSSRRLVVPEYVENQSVTMRYLSQLCHHDFLRTKVTNNMTVADSLNMMMRNTISGLRFSHPKTKCITDNHCAKWFNAQAPALRVNNVARCVEDNRDKFRTCEIRGRKEQSCSVFDSKGQRISEGKNEYTCDAGLRCMQVQGDGWLKGWSLYQYAKGKCVPAK